MSNKRHRKTPPRNKVQKPERLAEAISRRSFVKKSSAMLLISAVACGEDLTATPGPKGTIRVNVSGLSGSPANGGSALAQRTDIELDPIAIDISADGVGSRDDIPYGTYTVAYLEPNGFALTSEPVVTNVIVGEGQEGTADFAVIPELGLGVVRVIVTGLVGATGGGTASARLSSNTGSTFNVTLPPPTAGATLGEISGLPAGNYNVTYTAPSGFRLVNQGSSPAPATVAAGVTTDISFASEAVPAGGSVLFVSNWSSAALGSAGSSVNDGGRWNLTGGFGHEVVATTGLDFPSPKVAKFVAHRSNNGFCLLRKTGMPVLAVGSTRYYRWYVRMTFPDPLVGNGDHPWQDGNAVSDCNWMATCHYGSDAGTARNGQWQLGAYSLANGLSYAFDNGPWLSKHQTYRIEFALTRLSSTTYSLAARVYDRDGAQLFTEEHFPADFGGGHLGSRGPFPFKNVNNLDGFNCGTNDFETAGNDWWTNTFDYGFQGCFAVADDTGWIGAYGSLPGEPLAP